MAHDPAYRKAQEKKAQKKIAEALRTNATALDLSLGKLATVPPEITQLKNLIGLDLHDNRLTTISPEIAQLQNLTGLILCNNQLTEILPEVAELQNLTEFSLGRNLLNSDLTTAYEGTGLEGVLAYLQS
jgi:Leucine-rich repeat (LRR) protein